MPNVYQPGLLQIRPQYTPNPETGEVPQNILWFLSNTHTTPSEANLVAIAEQFDGRWGPLFAEYGATDGQYLGSVTTDWSSDTGLEWNSVGTFTPVGGASGAATPANVAALISYQIPLRWRGGHFRTYLPWVGSGGLDSTNQNKLAASKITNMTDDFNLMITSMSGTGILGGQVMVVYKNKTNALKATTYAFSTFTVQPFLASQRRRLRRVTRK